MISVLKENSKATFVESIPFDAADQTNTGITFSLIDYRDPETKKRQRFVSTLPETINPGKNCAY